MFLSVFDMFKIGVGPSSSHTMGPMVAAARFLDLMRASPFEFTGLRASLHGSLAFTGVGHATDRATILGLAGFSPETYDAKAAGSALGQIRSSGTVSPEGLGTLQFDPARDLTFDYDTILPGHTNGMILMATDAQGDVTLQQTYYSIGGGFVVTEAEQALEPVLDARDATRPYPFETAQMMLDMAAKSGKSIAELKRTNELAHMGAREFEAGLKRLWDAMNACIDRGLSTGGTLPGGLNVKRRARDIYQSLQAEAGLNLIAPHTINDWMCVYAMAVNEENADGHMVVTAPTNGAAGVLPAILYYFMIHENGSIEQARDFLLTASAVGGLIKHLSSISGAEVGCQGEVGSAASMAAAGLCAIRGGTAQQIEHAAEIALEHHLGMTCDPVHGLVQVPCIERNGFGAIKAYTATSLAIRGTGEHFMSLDNCIAAMKQTGLEMSVKFKETSLGGLAITITEC